jgi:hypothetical protein
VGYRHPPPEKPEGEPGSLRKQAESRSMPVPGMGMAKTETKMKTLTALDVQEASAGREVPS